MAMLIGILDEEPCVRKGGVDRLFRRQGGLVVILQVIDNYNKVIQTVKAFYVHKPRASAPICV